MKNRHQYALVGLLFCALLLAETLQAQPTNGALGFIDVNPSLFNEAGQPRLELYQPDQLHFKEPAYDAFAAIIKPVLAKEWAKAAKESE